MKIKLIFDDWRDKEGSVYNLIHRLSFGEFHSGTIFDGTIELPEDMEVEMKEAMAEGFRPVFWVMDK